MRKVLEYAKAIAALVGSVVTSLLAILPPDQYKWLAIVGIIATVVATYRIPNTISEDAPGKHEADSPTVG